MRVVHQQRAGRARRECGRELVEAVHHSPGLIGAAGRARRGAQHARTGRRRARRRGVGPRQRGLEQAADHRVRDLLLELVRSCAGGKDAKPRRRGGRVVEQLRLADTGRTLDEHDRPAPARRPGERGVQLSALAVALKQARTGLVATHTETVPGRPQLAWPRHPHRTTSRGPSQTPIRHR